MRRLNPWVVALAAAVTMLALLLLAPSGKHSLSGDNFNSSAGEGITTGGAPKTAGEAVMPGRPTHQPHTGDEQETGPHRWL